MTNTPDWKRLYHLAVEFRDLAPWSWMPDTIVFGVQDPATSTIGWCIVLGAGGDFEGLCAYRGDQGFDCYRMIQLMGEGETPEEFYGQDALLLSFGPRDDVSAAQRRVIKELGFKFRGRRAWVAFGDHRMGFMPTDLPGSAVPFMAACIEQTVAVATRIKEDPAYAEPDGAGRLLVRRLGAGDTWCDDRVAVPEPVDLPIPPVDQVALGRLRAACQRTDGTLDLDVFPAYGAAIDSDEGAFSPAVALAVDPGSGVILGQELCHPRERALAAQALLMQVVSQQKVIPGTICVVRPSVADAIAPVAAGLDTGVELVEDMPLMAEARMSLTAFLCGGLAGPEPGATAAPS